MIKKWVVATVFAAGLLSVIFAKPSKKMEEPEWIKNVNKVFPRSEYIAMLGTGGSGENARSEGSASLARYFSSNIKLNIDATKNFTEQDGKVSTNSTLTKSIQTESNMNFFGIEFTEPYFIKAEKKWYCVAYINRADAWEQFKPQIDIQKNEFNGLYKKLEKEEDYFSKIKALGKVRSSGEALLEKLEYGRLLSPKDELEYQQERDRIAELEVIGEDAKSYCSLFIKIDGDYNRSITTAVSTAFSGQGFNIVKAKNEGNYVAEVQIENNISGAEPLAIKPSVNIKVVSKSGKTVFSYEMLSEEKAVAYSLEVAQKKIYPKISEILKNKISEELENMLKR